MCFNDVDKPEGTAIHTDIQSLFTCKILFMPVFVQSAGKEVVDFLQYVCSNDVDRPVGTVIHTGMQNRHGGYENDCSVIRTEDNGYGNH